MDREAWWTIVHGVEKSRTRLSTHTHILFIWLRQVLVAAHKSFDLHRGTWNCFAKILIFVSGSKDSLTKEITRYTQTIFSRELPIFNRALS